MTNMTDKYIIWTKQIFMFKPLKCFDLTKLMIRKYKLMTFMQMINGEICTIFAFFFFTLQKSHWSKEVVQ